MAGGYYDYTYGSKGLQDPEEMMPLYSGKGYEPSGSASNMVPQSDGGASVANVGTGAATGAMMGGPAGAAIGAGGAFLTSYLAQRAADERARRDRAAQIENQYAQNQNQGFNTMMDAFRGALK